MVGNVSPIEKDNNEFEKCEKESVVMSVVALLALYAVVALIIYYFGR